jgi:pimeloyl-ACP methyl ester carboxylesterase
MELQPRLVDVRVPDDPAGIVLVMHGGASRRRSMMVSPTQLSVLRMVPIAKRIAHEGGGRLAVFRLLNSVRGWDSSHTPVKDAWWALGEIGERLGAELPACLVGHSLGGRAAVFAAAAKPEVRRVVALAPWFAPADDPGDLGDREVFFVHGSRDRIAVPSRARTVADRIARRGTPVRFELVEGARHAMLRHSSRFTDAAADWATAMVGADAEAQIGKAVTAP